MVEKKEAIRDKAIIFDLFGVIIQPGSMVKFNLHPMLKDHFSYKQLKDGYDKLQLGELTEREFWQNIPDSEKIEKKMFNIFKPAKDIDALKALKRHFKLYLLSNIPEKWGKHVLRKFALEKYFDRVFLSGAIGFQKPDAEAFQYVLDQTGFNAADCLFVDDRTIHLKSAASLGMHTVWLKKGQYPQKTMKPDYTAHSLQEIAELLLS
jgi:HAD superfamily hydrolase (TIGR01509 family)